MSTATGGAGRDKAVHWVVVSAWLFAACGDSGTRPVDQEPPNQAPTAVGSLDGWALTAQGSAVEVDVAERFRDPDGDALTYSVRSSDAGVAAAAASGSVVTVRPLAAGTATVTVTARDPGGLTAESSAPVTVHEPDLATGVSRDSVGLAAGSSFEFAVEVRNHGDGPGSAAATTVAAYVSADSVIEPTDKRVGEPLDVEALARGQLASVAAAFTADSAAALWTVVWVGACVEAVEGERETGNNCSRAIKVTTVPAMSWSFVSADGAESSAPTGDPKTVVRVAIDSYEPGPAGAAGWLSLDANDPQAVANALQMLEIKVTDNVYDSGYDLATRDWGSAGGCGPVCDDQVSVVATGSETVVAIRPPGIQRAWAEQAPRWMKPEVAVYQPGRYALSFGGLAPVELAVDSVEVLSCGYVPPGGDKLFKIVDGDMLVYRGSSASDRRSETGARLGRKADPNKTYVIDVAFVLVEEYSRGGWPEWMAEYGVPQITGIFQRSGVNVEFRPTFVSFQDYRHFAACQLDTPWTPFDMGILFVLRAKVGADLVHYVLSYDLDTDLFDTGLCGLAASRSRDADFSRARWASTWSSTDPTCSSSYTGFTPDVRHPTQRSFFIGVGAHEFGHNLGLLHDLSEHRDPLPLRDNVVFHPSGWGYRDSTAVGNTMWTYGTIMAYAPLRIPFFSSDRALPTSEVCNGDATRFDYKTNSGLCPSGQTYRLADDSIRLGGVVVHDGETYHVDAAEAMQYTIEDASKYWCRPGSCQ